jgi:hypothetical protein
VILANGKEIKLTCISALELHQLRDIEALYKPRSHAATATFVASSSKDKLANPNTAFTNSEIQTAINIASFLYGMPEEDITKCIQDAAVQNCTDDTSEYERICCDTSDSKTLIVTVHKNKLYTSLLAATKESHLIDLDQTTLSYNIMQQLLLKVLNKKDHVLYAQISKHYGILNGCAHKLPKAPDHPVESVHEGSKTDKATPVVIVGVAALASLALTNAGAGTEPVVPAAEKVLPAADAVVSAAEPAIAATSEVALEATPAAVPTTNVDTTRTKTSTIQTAT